MSRKIIAKSDILAKADALASAFVAEGASKVETDILLPAEVLLDLYGEDIRARAYVTGDPARGEMMLRPDFTVPVVQQHMAGDGLPSCYTYAGEVFRKQDQHPGRAIEYMQVGYELFNGDNPARADAEVFATFSNLLKGYDLRAVVGDIGILVAAVQGLNTTQARRKALLRHIWRPRRFRALMNRYSEKGTEQRESMLARCVKNSAADTAPFVGLRTQSQIDTRLAALQEDANAAPISNREIELLNDILSLKETMPNVLSALRDIAVDLPVISDAMHKLAARADAMADFGIDVDNLTFEASYGRTSMEYYDGFVFGFSSNTRADLPPVATGGRYDALTAVLGQGRSVPAVGGVMRPDLMLKLEGDDQ